MKRQEECVYVFVHLKLSTPCIAKVICFHGDEKDWAKTSHSKEQQTLEEDPTFLSLHLRFTKRKFQRLIAIMDRLAQHFLNRGNDDERSGTLNAIPLMAALGKTFVTQTVRRGEERRGRSRYQRSERVNLQRLGEYVVDSMERAEGRERGWGTGKGDVEKEEVADREERRSKRRDGHGHRHEHENGYEHGEEKRRKRRRRRSYDEDSYKKPREQDSYERSREHDHFHHHQQDHQHKQDDQQRKQQDQDQAPKDLHNSSNPNHPYISIPSPHQLRRPKLAALRTELEAMSETLTELNSRSASHEDCEFYDRFVENGGRLQEAIGEALGRMRDVEGGRRRRMRRRRRR